MNDYMKRFGARRNVFVRIAWFKSAGIDRLTYKFACIICAFTGQNDNTADRKNLDFSVQFCPLFADISKRIGM